MDIRNLARGKETPHATLDLFLRVFGIFVFPGPVDISRGRLREVGDGQATTNPGEYLGLVLLEAPAIPSCADKFNPLSVYT